MKTLKLNLPAFILFLLEAAVGVLLLVDPIGFTSVIIRAIGVIIAIGGIIGAVQYFRTPAKEAASSGMLFTGMLCLLMGVFLFTKTGWLIETLSILLVIYALVILILGVLKLQWTVDLIRMKREKWGVSGIGCVIAILFSILIIWNPFKSTEILWKLAGAALLLQAIFDIVGLVLCPRVVEGHGSKKAEPKKTQKSAKEETTEEEPDEMPEEK